MKFKSNQQKKAYGLAMQESYKAVAFDVDGTLTEFAKFKIPDYLLATLEKIPLEIPLVLCTGRPIDFVLGKIDEICNSTRNPEEQRRRWWIITENGGAAYFYDPKKEDYTAFYELKWPSERLEMDVLAAHLKNELGWHIKSFTRKHSVIVIYMKLLYLFPRLLRAESSRNARKIRQLLHKRKLDTEFVAQDSGLGTLIFPKQGGKGAAIQALAEHLGIDPKSILCIGDNPQSGGNDEDFLSGEFGTPFSVGAVLDQTYPLPVLDDRHVHLRGPKGTDHLLRQLFEI